MPDHARGRRPSGRRRGSGGGALIASTGGLRRSLPSGRRCAPRRAAERGTRRARRHPPGGPGRFRQRPLTHGNESVPSRYREFGCLAGADLDASDVDTLEGLQEALGRGTPHRRAVPPRGEDFGAAGGPVAARGERELAPRPSGGWSGSASRPLGASAPDLERDCLGTGGESEGGPKSRQDVSAGAAGSMRKEQMFWVKMIASGSEPTGTGVRSRAKARPPASPSPVAAVRSRVVMDLGLRAIRRLPDGGEDLLRLIRPDAHRGNTLRAPAR